MLFSFVPKILGMLGNGSASGGGKLSAMFGLLAGKASANPKTSDFLTSLLALGAGWFGIDKTDFAAVGNMLVTAGELVKRVSGQF